MISSSQRPLPDNTQQSQQTNFHVLGGIRTRDLSRRAVADLCLRPPGHWDRRLYLLPQLNLPISVFIAYFSTWWRSWLRHYDASRKVVVSIPDDVIGIFLTQSFRSHYGLGVDSDLTFQSLAFSLRTTRFNIQKFYMVLALR